METYLYKESSSKHIISHHAGLYILYSAKKLIDHLHSTRLS